MGLHPTRPPASRLSIHSTHGLYGSPHTGREVASQNREDPDLIVRIFHPCVRRCALNLDSPCTLYRPFGVQQSLAWLLLHLAVQRYCPAPTVLLSIALFSYILHILFPQVGSREDCSKSY